MTKWSIELSKFDITFESRKALKAHTLADFIVGMKMSNKETTKEWTMYIDGSSNSQGSGAILLLVNNVGIMVEISLKLSFPTSNNQVLNDAYFLGFNLG